MSGVGGPLPSAPAEMIADCFRELNPTAHQAGRETERADVTAYLIARAASVDNLTQHGRFSKEDGERLSRALRVVAGDLEAGLHDRSETP